MKKFNLFKTFDLFFRLVVIFLIYLVWSRYFIKSLWLSILVTVVLTLFTDFLIKFVSNKRKHKKNIKEEELKTISNYINSLICMEDNLCVNFFYELASKKHNATKNSKYITIDHQNGRVVLYPYFLYRDFCIDDLVLVYNKIKNKNVGKLIICTNNVDNSVHKFIKYFPQKIILLNGNETYIKLLKKYEHFPPVLKLNDQTKTNFNDLISFALNKKRTKGYFVSSILMLFSSFIVPYKIYYVIISTILLILALVSFYNPTFNKHNESEILGN